MILAPMDFSSNSVAALDWAVALARETGAKIHLLHSYGVPVRGVVPYDFTVPDGVWDGIGQAAETKLDQIRKEVVAAGVEASSEVSSAMPCAAILDAAERIGADLIVMGTRGLTGLKHVLLGSVAERTIRMASCSVLTVKEDP
jgi:nucleotide-binding universal stress UspA family protein